MKSIPSISVFLIVLTSTNAMSNPIWDSSDCDTSGVYDALTPKTSDHIYYYVESDLASEFKSCSTISTNSELTEFHIRQRIKDSFEIWNAESRAATLVYGGDFSYSGLFKDLNCNTSFGALKKPAVVVTYTPGCRLDDMMNCTLSKGQISKLCDDVSFIVVRGDINTDGACNSLNNGIVEWNFNRNVNITSSSHYASNPRRPFHALLIHEIGHLLGLGHPNDNNVPNVDSNSNLYPTVTATFSDPPPAPPFQFNVGESAMWGGALESGHYGHLWSWEKDCVDQRWGGRKAYAYSKSYSSSGVLKETEHITTSHTEKGSLSGYPWEDDDYSYPFYAYSIYNPDVYWDAYHRIASVGSDGLLGWTSNGSRWDQPGYENFGTLDTNFLFTNTDPSADWRATVYYNYIDTSSGAYPSADPPKIAYTDGENLFDSIAFWGDLKEQGSGDIFQSHIPPSSAYDPVTGETVFVTVNTSRTNTDTNGDQDLSQEGRISVHPGFYAGSNFVYPGELLNNNTTIPSDPYASWSYARETNFAPGVACADSVAAGMNGYNCVLAWIDRGTPDNRILYTWFKLDGSSPNVLWHGTAYVRGGTYAIGHVSMGHFNGKIYMSYKNTGAPGGIATTSNDLTGFAAWDTVTHFTPGYDRYIVDSPTWATMGSSNEAAMMWTMDGQPGGYDYCTEFLCFAGEGDCDSDAECVPGTTCTHDVGATYGYPADVDVCEY